jgi:hypothetical protein
VNLADKIVMKVRPPMPENPNQVGVVRERFPTRTPSGMGVRQIAANSDRRRMMRSRAAPLRNRKFADSPLEGDGCEPSVPLAKQPVSLVKGEVS